MKDTPRTNRFVKEHTIRFRPEDFSNTESLLLTALLVKELLLEWEAFARDLEREVNQSVPKEWA